jgi:non-heme chloroperoxidase
MKHEVKRIALPGRLTIDYVDHGDASGFPVIALHGITDSWRSFEPLLPHLPPTLRIFALNQRGHGGAEAPPSGYLPRDFADDIAAFADATGVSRAVVVGHSMGASNALRFAIDYPERVAGLVLLGAFASFQRPDLESFLLGEVQQLEDPIDVAFARDFQQSTLTQPVPPDFFETVMRECLKTPARVWRDSFAGLLRHDYLDQLGAVQAPTVLLWGRHDTYSLRDDQQKLLAGIAHCSLVEYADAGHALHWEEPARVAADLTAFAARADLLAVARRQLLEMS